MLCFGNISKKHSPDTIQNTGLYRYFYDLSVDYDSTDVDNILDILDI